jgi:hypothetical protein
MNPGQQPSITAVPSVQLPTSFFKKDNFLEKGQKLLP